MNIKKKLPFYYVFYRSTLKISILATVFVGGLLLRRGTWKEVLIYMFQIYPFLGLAADYFYKEVMRKNEYYFYYNVACNKLELWIAAFIQASFVSLVLFQLGKIGIGEV